VAWSEHEEAWREYHRQCHNDQDAETIAQRGGFGYKEITTLLGREPTTWRAVEELAAGYPDWMNVTRWSTHAGVDNQTNTTVVVTKVVGWSAEMDHKLEELLKEEHNEYDSAT
jgi:hypothetical protein